MFINLRYSRRYSKKGVKMSPKQKFEEAEDFNYPGYLTEDDFDSADEFKNEDSA